MLSKIEEYTLFLNTLKQSKVAVVGLGIGNIDLFKFLAVNKVEVCGFDKAEHLPKLQSFIKEYPNAKLVLGDTYLDKLEGFDYIFKTQSMRRDIPQFLDAIEQGAVLTSEMWEFFRLCPATIIGVTGSSGKTTTTTIIGEFLKKQGHKVWVGGNIGQPLFHRLSEISKEDYVVLEIASCQLQMFGKRSPNIAVLTNVTPNHLDFHDNYDEYIYCKSKIFLHQDSSDLIVLNNDNDITKELSKDTIATTYMFSSKENANIENGCFIKNNNIYFSENNNERKILDINDIKIPGRHNVENYMAAIAAVQHLVSDEVILDIARSFGGVQHRNEFVREFNDVKFYNDSIGTTPERTDATLRSFKQKVILITGGYDKQIPYDIMGALINDKVKALILMGQTKDKILSAYTKHLCTVPYVIVDNMTDAVNMAVEYSKPGDIIVMSPASASFDMYKNFEEKGDIYKSIVHSL